mmetsp:Transcript_17147/g.34140  ORF Transcript_17147/g.34140 Transcript_17147/m.34140 type:complete len:126 (-) Transcript_17147:36-413(-)
MSALASVLSLMLSEMVLLTVTVTTSALVLMAKMIHIMDVEVVIAVDLHLHHIIMVQGQALFRAVVHLEVVAGDLEESDDHSRFYALIKKLFSFKKSDLKSFLCSGTNITILLMKVRLVAPAPAVL